VHHGLVWGNKQKRLRTCHLHAKPCHSCTRHALTTVTARPAAQAQVPEKRTAALLSLRAYIFLKLRDRELLFSTPPGSLGCTFSVELARTHERVCTGTGFICCKQKAPSVRSQADSSAWMPLL
jgi:hypothetical protein